MRIIAIITTIALLSACSDSGEHPPLAPEDQPEFPGVSTQLLTGCAEPFPKTHTMTNVIPRAFPPSATCPSAWYRSWDPFTWKAGKVLGGSDPTPPTVPLGQCFWTRPLKWAFRACTFDMSFLCPNGIEYVGRMTASELDWSKATILIDAYEPGCRRQAMASFNVVAP